MIICIWFIYISPFFISLLVLTGVWGDTKGRSLKLIRFLVLECPVHSFQNRVKTMSFIKNLAAIFLLLMISNLASAACRYVGVDHDYNSSTPATRKQVCDSSIDIPTMNFPNVRPIQKPEVKPIQIPSIPPIGTTRCRNESVYENGKWVTKRVCR